MSPKELARIKTNRNLLEWALENAGGKMYGDGICCPFHEDNNPSGSIHEGNGDGAYLYTCHAECKWHKGSNSGDVLAVVQRFKRVSFKKAYKMLVVLEAGPAIQRVADGIRSKPTQVSPYQEADGRVRLIVVRFDDGDGKKTYRPFHRGPSGWKIGDSPPPLPLYGLPDLGGAGVVYVVEGEKCVEAARKIGLIATTSAHGAKGAKKTDWSPLAGRDVVILPDNNDAGRQYAEDVRQLLAGLNTPTAARILALPDLPPGGDIVDFVTEHQGTEPEVVQAEIDSLADRAEFVSVPELRSAIEEERGMEVIEARRTGENSFSVISIGNFLAQADEETPWVVERLLPAGGLSILTAKPKVGKTTLVRTLIQAVSRGDAFLGRATAGGPVIYLCFEDSPSEVRKAFRKLEATASDAIGICWERAAPGKSIGYLQRLIEEHDPVLIVIDTIGKFLEVRDFNDYGEVNRAFGPLLSVVRKAIRCHVLFTHHAPKTERGGGDDVLGSTAFFGNVDTVVNMVKKTTNGSPLLCSNGTERTFRIPSW